VRLKIGRLAARSAHLETFMLRKFMLLVPILALAGTFSISSADAQTRVVIKQGGGHHHNMRHRGMTKKVIIHRGGHHHRGGSRKVIIHRR
jgi:hypothetical protein